MWRMNGTRRKNISYLSTLVIKIVIQKLACVNYILQFLLMTIQCRLFFVILSQNNIYTETTNVIFATNKAFAAGVGFRPNIKRPMMTKSSPYLTPSFIFFTFDFRKFLLKLLHMLFFFLFLDVKLRQFVVFSLVDFCLSGTILSIQLKRNYIRIFYYLKNSLWLGILLYSSIALYILDIKGEPVSTLAFS